MTETERQQIARRRRLTLVRHLGLSTTTEPPELPVAAPFMSEAQVLAWATAKILNASKP